jgi:flagellar assembly factor FliW
MKFTTTRFGEIEFPEDVVLQLPDGILGFHDDRRFILLEHNVDGSPFRWFQSLDNADLAFIVVDPMLLDPRYEVEIDRDTAAMIATDAIGDCAIVAIINVPHDNPYKMTANLKAPIVINAANRMGRQLVLRSNIYTIGTPVFPTINLHLGNGDADHDPEHKEAVLQSKAASG